MPKRTQPSRLIAGSHQPGRPVVGRHPFRGAARKAITPEARKQIEPRASGRQTSLSYPPSAGAVCSAWYVDTLKKSVPADCTTAAHQPDRPAPREVRSGDASQTWSAPPAVNMMEP